MPRVNTRTLWFEDIKFTRQGVIDTPFGRLSVRQAAGIGFFALLAWLTSQALAFVQDIFFKAIPAVLIFIAGAVIFSWRIKTVPVERQLLLAFSIGKRMRTPRAAKKKTKAKAGKGVPPPVEVPLLVLKPAKVQKAQATVGEPFKITGILRDAKFGKPLPNCNFDVLVDGSQLYKGATDRDGGFEAVYIPENPGVVRVEVRPEGYAGHGVVVEVTVRGGM